MVAATAQVVIALMVFSANKQVLPYAARDTAVLVAVPMTLSALSTIRHLVKPTSAVVRFAAIIRGPTAATHKVLESASTILGFASSVWESTVTTQHAPVSTTAVVG